MASHSQRDFSREPLDDLERLELLDLQTLHERVDIQGCEKLPDIFGRDWHGRVLVVEGPLAQGRTILHGDSHPATRPAGGRRGLLEPTERPDVLQRDRFKPYK